MCTSPEQDPTTSKKAAAPSKTYKNLAFFLGLTTLGFAIATIILATQQNGGSSNDASAASVANVPVEEHTAEEHAAEEVAAQEVAVGVDFLESKATSSFFATEEDNVCAGAKLAFENKLCVDLEVVPPQAGANVTNGYVGNLDVNGTLPNTKPYWQSGMCPVNVHWHLGSEHYSYGEYDEGGNGPDGNIPRPEWAERTLAEAAAEVQDGFRCHHYDASDAKFTTPYDWQHCKDMEVGETYEVHWPHSAAGDCGTVNQYQTPFYDGVFCNLPLEAFMGLAAQDIANAVGVHGQVFTIVNDESYFYPDMIRGMVLDKPRDMGQDIAIYTGSTTGETRNNEMCSQYAPITWQVDRKCHMISASSFDKLCYDMKLQRDDMSDDLHAHGSRELVHNNLTANNQYYPDGVRKIRKNLRA